MLYFIMVCYCLYDIAVVFASKLIATLLVAIDLALHMNPVQFEVSLTIAAQKLIQRFEKEVDENYSLKLD